jgi:hypothetical protein
MKARKYPRNAEKVLLMSMETFLKIFRVGRSQAVKKFFERNGIKNIGQLLGFDFHKENREVWRGLSRIREKLLLYFGPDTHKFLVLGI